MTADLDSSRVRDSLPQVIELHVHLLLALGFAAMWRWFRTNAWTIRYEIRTPEIIEFLFSRGLERIVALHFAHKPGMARALNAYMAEVCRADPRIVGLATVFPGE